jgi:hypothetical protein
MRSFRNSCDIKTKISSETGTETENEMIKFSPCQEKAFAVLDGFFENDRKRFCMILGAGGVGKTSSLQHYFKEANGTFSIHKFAPTHQAKRELQRSLGIGYPAETIASFFSLTSVIHPSTLKEEYREAGRWKASDESGVEVMKLSEMETSKIVWKFQAFKLPKHEVFKKAIKGNLVVVMIIDEISMINLADFRRIVDLLEEFPELKIVLLGDHMQLPPVESADNASGSAFFKPDFYKRSDVSRVVMKTVVRQSDPVVAGNLSYIRECIKSNRPVNFERLQTSENFQIVSSLLDHITEFDDISSDVRAIAWRNVTVDDLNKRITDMRHGGTENRGQGRAEFMAGDTVVFRGPYQSEDGIRINNGDVFTIRSISTLGNKSNSSNLLEFEMIPLDGKTLDSGHNKEEEDVVKVYRFQDPRQFANAKRALESRIRKEDDLSKRSEMIKKEMLKIKASHAFFKMGWASTVHGVQSMSITRILVDANDICRQWDVVMRNKLLYTAISRMREKAIIAYED